MHPILGEMACILPAFALAAALTGGCRLVRRWALRQLHRHAGHGRSA